MARAYYQTLVEYQTGGAASGVAVTVVALQGSVAVNIYDVNGSVLANPITTGSTPLSFYADGNGPLDLLISVPGLATTRSTLYPTRDAHLHTGTDGSQQVNWTALLGIPGTFAPSAHAGTHAAAGSDPVSPASIGASATGHSHAEADVTSLVADLFAIPRPNLLVNGNIDIWQRGVGPFTANGAYTADHWNTFLAGTDTLSVSKDTTNQDTTNGSIACAACTFVLGSGGGLTAFQQPLKTTDGYTLAGKTISLSVRVKTATANAVRAGINTNGTGGTNTFSSFHTGGGTYQTLTVTITVPADATQVFASVFFAASCTAYADSANLVYGTVATNLYPGVPADEFHRNQRYYEDLGVSQNGTLGVTGIATAASQHARATYWFRARKPVTPTVTKVGTWTVTNCAQPTIDALELDYCEVDIISTAAGAFNVFNTAGCHITVEANP